MQQAISFDTNIATDYDTDIATDYDTDIATDYDTDIDNATISPVPCMLIIINITGIKSLYLECCNL